MVTPRNTNKKRSVTSQNNHIYGNVLSVYINIWQISDVTKRQLFTCKDLFMVTSDDIAMLHKTPRIN